MKDVLLQWDTAVVSSLQAQDTLLQEDHRKQRGGDCGIEQIYHRASITCILSSWIRALRYTPVGPCG